MSFYILIKPISEVHKGTESLLGYSLEIFEISK